MKNKILTILLGVCIAVLIITFSIGLPIYFRPFYYMQIDALEIEEYYNSYAKYYNFQDVPEVSREDIIEAYDEVLDYLTIPGNEFGTGKLPYREWTETHFADCKVLFDLNAICFIVAFIGAAVLLILKKCGKFELWHPFGMNISFYSGAITLGGFAVIGGLAALDFNKAFEVFHLIFFPGKDNWIFHPVYDRVILIMPQDFFMNCAILILSSIVLLCIGCICSGLIDKYRARLKANTKI